MNTQKLYAVVSPSRFVHVFTISEDREKAWNLFCFPDQRREYIEMGFQVKQVELSIVEG